MSTPKARATIHHVQNEPKEIREKFSQTSAAATFPLRIVVEMFFHKSVLRFHC